MSCVLLAYVPGQGPGQPPHHPGHLLPQAPQGLYHWRHEGNALSPADLPCARIFLWWAKVVGWPAVVAAQPRCLSAGGLQQ